MSRFVSRRDLLRAAAGGFAASRLLRAQEDARFSTDVQLVNVFASVRDAIKELHSYDVPECICVNIEDGSAEYLKWIRESVQAAK